MEFDTRNVHMAAERSYPADCLYLYVWMYDKHRDRTSIPQNVVFDTLPDGEHRTPGPLLALSFEHATRLMDDLWNAGIRPTQSKHSAELVQAKDAHIQDQRSVIDRLFALVSK